MLLMNRNSGFSMDCCPHPNPSLVLRTSNACPRGTATARVAKEGAYSLTCKHALEAVGATKNRPPKTAGGTPYYPYDNKQQKNP